MNQKGWQKMEQENKKKIRDTNLLAFFHWLFFCEDILNEGLPKDWGIKTGSFDLKLKKKKVYK